MNKKPFWILASALLIACSSNTEETKTTIPVVDSIKVIEGHVYEAKTFEVKDSTTNKVLGWGYDIYIDNKRTIHQPHIPAVQGNSYFATEEDALKTGRFAADKMKTTGSLPTISLEELESLGIIKK